MNNSRNFAQSQAGLLLAKGTIISISVVSIFTNNISSAQITPDTTLGNQSSRVTTGVNIKGHETDLIEGGVQRGSSLFHSFTEFNVNNGQRVYFANPTGIADIFSRVTGSNASHILGTLGVNGAANLYLLNPNGIIFGTNAKLDIQGSLFATTANSFQFPDGSEFSATNPQVPPLLTMSVPVGVQYGLQQTASIINQGNLVTGKNLTLNAGSLDLQGKLEAGGDISLNSQQGTIDIHGDIISTTPNGIAGNITIQSVDDIRIFKNIKASSNSNINPNNDQAEYNIIAINSTRGSIYLNGSQLNVTNSGSGFAGDIMINANDQISILNGSKISSNGNMGRIFIGVGDSNKITPKRVNIDNSGLNVDNYSSDGNTGSITIYSFEEISIKNSYILSGRGSIASSRNDDGSGANGGTVSIESQGLVSLDNLVILADVFSSDQNGTGGDINISARSLIIKNGSKLDTSTSGTGNAGDVTITASDSVLLENSQISSSLSGMATGKGGNIKIETSFLTADKGIIEAQSPGKGDGGDINITTLNLWLRRQSRISTTAGAEGLGGNGGSIRINAKGGFIVAVPSEDSNIVANAFGGNGGKINISANRTLGFQNRGKLSPNELNAIITNGTSEISASSDYGEDGEVAIETLSIDPSQGLVELPTQLVDPSRLIAQGCGSPNNRVAKGQSEFVITGRGGLPPSPDDILKPGIMSPEWVVNNTRNYSNNSENITVKEMDLKQLSSNTSNPLVEAVGMVHNADGDVVLTTQPTVTTLLQSGLSSKVCGLIQGNVRE
ncbi:filamentous hemagglutinin N-terminal domain-containing protein [Anabaena sp. CCY 9910]|uniref:two-partner secretion domain-containing protein n=1 Tax=Anabaena sp. CCY 9910 TaxID=3103870 RepID=UPI0039E0DA47